METEDYEMKETGSESQMKNSVQMNIENYNFKRFSSLIKLLKTTLYIKADGFVLCPQAAAHERLF